jgi:hypothetical protein
MYKTRYADPAYLAIADGLTAIAASWASRRPRWPSPGSRPPGGDVGAARRPRRGAARRAVDRDRDRDADPALRARIGALTPEPPPATDRNEERSAANYGAR